MAGVTRRLCTEYVDPGAIGSLTACRLIALNKNPGVQPIGVAETLRRIMGKAILATISDDIQKAAGSVQPDRLQKSKQQSIAYKDDGVEAAVFVDASNAFNNLNREAALRNIHNICPALAVIATNTYRRSKPSIYQPAEHSVEGGHNAGRPSRNGHLCNCYIWYADDATASGKLSNLKEWWDKLSVSGPDFGYFPNTKKSVVVTKPLHLEEATTIFAECKMAITTEGTKYLGTPIGDEAFVNMSIEQKIAEWVEEIKQLSSIAQSEPQAAFAAFTHIVASEWLFFLRTVPVTEAQLAPLEETIRFIFIPAISGHSAFTDKERISCPTCTNLERTTKTSNDPVTREKPLPLADHSSNGRTWIPPPQGNISRRTVPHIRVEAGIVAYSLCVWKAAQC